MPSGQEYRKVIWDKSRQHDRNSQPAEIIGKDLIIFSKPFQIKSLISETFVHRVASLTTFSPCARLEVGVFVITRMLGKNMPGLLYIGQMDKMLYTMQYMHFMQLGIYKYTNIALKWK